MPQDEFRIFLSAVSSEFGKARDAVAADLRSRETLLRVQSDFRQEAGSDTTLKKLHDYIRDCSAVVCVIGKRSVSAGAGDRRGELRPRPSQRCERSQQPRLIAGGHEPAERGGAAVSAGAGDSGPIQTGD